MARRPPALRIAFLIAVTVKGFDGLVETAMGSFLAAVGTQGLYDLVLRVTAPELDLHPASRTLHAVRHGAAHLAQDSGLFVIFWLLAHGVVKLALAIELLRGRKWIFPVAAIILSGFVGYMTYRYTLRPSPWLLAFALFDALTVALVLNEWRVHDRRGKGARA